MAGNLNRSTGPTPRADPPTRRKRAQRERELEQVEKEEELEKENHQTHSVSIAGTHTHTRPRHSVTDWPASVRRGNTGVARANRELNSVRR